MKHFECKNANDCSVEPYHPLYLTITQRSRGPQLGGLMAPTPASSLVKAFMFFAVINWTSPSIINQYPNQL